MNKHKNTFNLDKVSEFNNVIVTKEKQLLLEAPSESLEIVKAIHLTHHLNKIENEKNKFAKYSHFKEEFNANVYSGLDIKKLCNKYDLKLCRAEEYKGTINSELIEKINTFYKSHEYEVEKYNEEGEIKKIIKKSKINTTPRNFFILAPSETFLKDNISSQNVTLFYREDDYSNYANETDMFVEVYTWGNNYSELRKIRPYLNTYKYSFDENNDSISTRSINIILLVLFFSFLIPLIITDKLYPMFIINSVILMLILFNNLSMKDSLHYKNWNKYNFIE